MLAMESRMSSLVAMVSSPPWWCRRPQLLGGSVLGSGVFVVVGLGGGLRAGASSARCRLRRRVSSAARLAAARAASGTPPCWSIRALSP